MRRHVPAILASLGAWLAAFLAAPTPPASAQAAPMREPVAVRLLTVGNSFSQDATRLLDAVAKAQGDALVHRQAAIPGGTLQQHVEKAERHARRAADPSGRYAGTGRSLVEELRDGPWDFVTIQQASIRSHDPATYRPYAAALVDLIRREAHGARVVVHETWAYRVDDPRFDAGRERAPGEPADREAMYRGLAEAYREVARELDAPIVPVGDAFHLADSDPTWGFRPDPAFDLSRAAHPALPDQSRSLHVGRKWSRRADGSFELSMDGHHASPAGQYLGALVFYESLFGESAVGCDFRPKRMDADYARFLQETAHRAVEALRGTEFEVRPKARAAARR